MYLYALVVMAALYVLDIQSANALPNDLEAGDHDTARRGHFGRPWAQSSPQSLCSLFFNDLLEVFQTFPSPFLFLPRLLDFH